MNPEIIENDSEFTRGVENIIPQDESLGQPQDPLALDVPDEELIRIVDFQIDQDKKFWNNKYNLTERRKRMETALFGRQISERERNNELKKYEARYSDNAIWEIEADLKPVAMSHLPDMIVSPGSETPESQKSSDELSKIVNDDIKKRQNRQVLGLGFKHLPVYLTAVIKTRWNPQLGEHGDFEFLNVHPDRIVIARSANKPSSDLMPRVSELLTETVQEIIMKFPKKKDQLFKKLKGMGKVGGKDDFSWKDMATEIDYWEVHFTWYKKAKDADLDASSLEEPGNKWERIEGILWKFEDIVFGKMKTPNFDYEGKEQWFTYDDPSNENSKRQLTEQDLMGGLMTGQMPPISQEQIYYNFFQAPKKPYFFFGYDQWGKVAIDETSRIEQNLHNQENLNVQGAQIINTIKARVKHIWSTDSGLGAEDVQNLDMENPRLDALVDGKVNEVHAAVEPERPDAAQFNALKLTKDNMFASAGATALTGEMQSDVATTNQIAREQNFTRADDLVEDTINAAAEWIAQWEMHWIKLRYTEDHFRKLLGGKGTFTFYKIKRDKVEDGMEVMIKASGTDKLKAQRNAMDAAKLGAPFVNPLDFFKDMEYSDPEGRTERGIIFAMDPNMFLAQFVMGLQNTGQQVDALLGPGSAQNFAGAAPTQTPASQPVAPQNPTPTDTTKVPSAPPAFPQGSPRAL